MALTAGLASTPAILPLSRLAPLLLALAALPFSSHAQPVSYTALTNDQPVFGSLAASSAAYYSFAVLGVSSPQQQQQTVLLGVSALTGSPSLYVSLLDSPPPSSVSCNWSASWQTGNVLTLPQPPPYTAHVAVVASPYSSSNYTLTVTAYDPAVKQSTPIPLYDAQPTSSAIAAGEYRYFAYNVSANASASTATIALTETYGQSWLLLNSPNATQLPTLAQAQYMSASATFPLVALQQPAAGVWTIGVWCNASSAFSIVAVSHTATLPMELGITYPGWAPTGQYVYYSLYLDALLLAQPTSSHLQLQLATLSGDADLYCSYDTTQPGPDSYMWESRNWALQPDRIAIPAAQLRAASLYCGVNAYETSSYSFLASFSSATTLTAGETVSAQSEAGGSQLYSMVLPADSSLVTLSVVADVGTTVLYIVGYGPLPTATNFVLRADEATEQLQLIAPSTLCGWDGTQTIPGSSPPLCQLQVLVRTPGPSTYRIVATTGGQLVALVPGLPVEGAASSNQSAYFSFVVPSDLSNVTLIVSVSNGASGVTLAIAVRNYGSLRTLWTVAQQSGSNELSFQLDWNSPQLFYATLVAGEYAAVLSAAAELATFSVVYTLTDVDANIVQLLDGVPQAASASTAVNGYSFYYFQPPATGWPYAVTVSVTWTSGFGTVFVAATDGPVARLVSDYDDWLVYASDDISITPTMAGICNPSINSTCGYSISVQLQQPGDYSITVTSGQWVRRLYPSAPIAQSGELAVGDSDYWQSTVLIEGVATGPQLMVAITMLRGSATLFASNVTSAPNTSTAQQTWTGLSSAAVLGFPLTAGLAQWQPAYLTVLCVSTDSVACEYTLQAQMYYDPPSLYSLIVQPSSLSTPVSLLLPAGGIRWLTYAVWNYADWRQLIPEAVAAVGTPSLYASCFFWPSPTAQLPNETYHTWQAVTAPLLIELPSYTTFAEQCPEPSKLVLGVRASGDQAALVTVVVATAGAVQDITDVYLANGVLTPAYPVGYYQYTLQNDGLSVVLAFTLSSSCSLDSTDQLQMVVGDTTPYPNPADSSTYNYSRTAVTLSNGAVDFTIAISKYSSPAGMLHVGDYYVAVTRPAGVRGIYEYQLRSWEAQRELLLGQFVEQWLRSERSSSYLYFTFWPVPYNTSTSFAVQVYSNVGVIVLYVGVDSTPSPADPSTYLLSMRFDTAQPGYSGMYIHQQSTYHRGPVRRPHSRMRAVVWYSWPSLVTWDGSRCVCCPCRPPASCGCTRAQPMWQPTPRSCPPPTSSLCRPRRCRSTSLWPSTPPSPSLCSARTSTSRLTAACTTGRRARAAVQLRAMPAALSSALRGARRSCSSTRPRRWLLHLPRATARCRPAASSRTASCTAPLRSASRRHWRRPRRPRRPRPRPRLRRLLPPLPPPPLSLPRPLPLPSLRPAHPAHRPCRRLCRPSPLPRPPPTRRPCRQCCPRRRPRPPSPNTPKPRTRAAV